MCLSVHIGQEKIRARATVIVNDRLFVRDGVPRRVGPRTGSVEVASMTEEDEPNIVIPDRSRMIMVDGVRFNIEAYRPETDTAWTREVVDPENTSHVWDEKFASDKDAWNAAIELIGCEELLHSCAGTRSSRFGHRQVTRATRSRARPLMRWSPSVPPEGVLVMTFAAKIDDKSPNQRESCRLQQRRPLHSPTVMLGPSQPGEQVSFDLATSPKPLIEGCGSDCWTDAARKEVDFNPLSTGAMVS